MADDVTVIGGKSGYEGQSSQVEDEHQCGIWCGKIEDEQIQRLGDNVRVLKDGIYLRKSSPFAAPFALGWERFDYHYNSPCGVKFYDLKHILKFLIKIKSKLSIKQFTFHNDFTYISLPLSSNDNVICEDISNGKEPIAIRCINNHDDQGIDPNFEYVVKNIYPSKINCEPRAYRSSCTCQDDCKNVLTCQCRHLTDEAEDLGQLHGLLDSKFFAGYQAIEKELPRPYVFGLYECNSGCKCSNRCHNKVIQNGMTNQLEVFRTEDRGWGVRCRHDIQSGEFVTTYSGEIISNAEAERRGTDNDEYFTKMNLIEIVENKEGFEETAREMSDVGDEVSKQALETASDVTEKSTSSLSDISCSSSSSSSSGIEFVFMRDKNKRIIQEAKPKNRSGKKVCVKKDSAKCDWKDIDKFLPVRKYIAENTIENGDVEISEEGKNDKSPVESQEELYKNEVPGGESKAEVQTEEVPSQESSSSNDRLDDFQYVLDAKRKGNIGRFLNHSCKPNCFLQIVFTDSHDPRIYQLAFFTSQKINAMKELTWNYLYQKEDKEKFVCLCDFCKQDKQEESK